jgi:glycosyltransferase involved in cell wall biosynthesis
MNRAVVFTRGNYATLHDYLSNSDDEASKPIWLHYPATALMFPHLENYKEQITTSLSEPTFDSRVLSEQVTGMIVEHQLKPILGESSLARNLENLWNRFEKRRTEEKPSPYDIVLIDDKSSFLLYQNIYSDSMVVPFVKPVLPTEIVINYHRKYDMMFCGTTLQSTKNHLQFISLLDRIDRETDEILRICIAGDRGDLPAFTQSLEREYVHLEIDNFGEVSRTELFDLYNQSRTLLVMSGRDCNPRIIQEAGVCGVFVIAADTMSDGTEILKDEAVIGAIIPTKKASWFYQKNGNVVFDVNTSFAQKVLRSIKNAHSPFLVHETALRRYSLEKAAEYIAAQITMLG